MRFAHGVTVTVQRGGTDPRTGDPLPMETHEVSGCGIAPRTSSETDNLGNSVIVGKTLLAPYGADILATDQIFLPGDDVAWEVEGDPGDWRSPFTGWEAGAQIALTRHRGS